MAVAQEQEMQAHVVEMRARVVEAEALRSGNLGVMDYVKYRNVQADTAMRKAIAGPQEGGTDTPPAS